MALKGVSSRGEGGKVVISQRMFAFHKCISLIAVMPRAVMVTSNATSALSRQGCSGFLHLCLCVSVAEIEIYWIWYSVPSLHRWMKNLKRMWWLSHTLFHLLSSGPDNSSDTESAPSPSQTDPSKSYDSLTHPNSALDGASDLDATATKGSVADDRGQEPPYCELQVKVEKSPEGDAGDGLPQDERAHLAYEMQIHPKSEPQDVEMKEVSERGQVQVKTEPEVKDKEEKQGEQHQSDNDSSATCSADEEVEPDRQRLEIAGPVLL